MVREKIIRNHHRKSRSMLGKPPNLKFSDHLTNPIPESVPKHPNPSTTVAYGEKFDETSWGYCTEDQLEELLLKNLEFLYNEAITKLVSLGYDESVALKSILRNGHCYGSMDVLENILHNAMKYINSTGCGDSDDEDDEVVDEDDEDEDDDDDDNDDGNLDGPESGFTDLRQMEEYSLAGMVCLLQQLRPQLSKGDAMWCLLMNDLHVGQASTMEIPVLPPGSAGGDALNGGMSPEGLCKFHGSWGFGGMDLPIGGSLYDPSLNFTPAVTCDFECPKRFNLSPSMKSLLKSNVAVFAAVFRANSKVAVQSLAQSQTCPRSFSGNGVLSGGGQLGPEGSTDQNEEPTGSQNSDVVNSAVLSSLGNMSLDEKTDGAADKKNEMTVNLMHQIRELEGQLKERKEWAHQKALQAAKKLSYDLTELKILRMEKEETLRLKKGKQTLEDMTMKRLSEMENALRKASSQVDRANASVRRLETENAEIKAEMEASKLSASESMRTCLDIAKREKKCLKKLLAWEKQKTKLQEEVLEERNKIEQLQKQLHLVKDAQKETDVKWRQELKAKEIALAQVEEERRAKETAEASVKRRQEALRRKIEIDFQLHKDDIQRLEQELSRLKVLAESAQLNYSSNIVVARDLEMAKTPKETNGRMIPDLYKTQEPSYKEVNHDRECLVCMKDEVSVVFLPCAHQVLCASCNEHHEREAKANCPCCSIRIEQRIRVYGAAS